MPLLVKVILTQGYFWNFIWKILREGRPFWTRLFRSHLLSSVIVSLIVTNLHLKRCKFVLDFEPEYAMVSSVTGYRLPNI